MILRWSVLRRAIRTLHRRQNVSASWENIELSHIHIYIYIYRCAGCWLMFLDCSQSNASQWLWRPVWFLQSPGTTSRRVLPVYAFCLNWVQIAESKVFRPHAIHRNSLFCSGRIFVQKLTGWCCFQHEDLQNLRHSVQLIVTRIPISFIPLTVQFALHGMSMEPLESRQLERSLGYPRMLEESSRSPRLCSGRSKPRSPRPRPRRQGQMLRAHLHHQLELPAELGKYAYFSISWMNLIWFALIYCYFISEYVGFTCTPKLCQHAICVNSTEEGFLFTCLWVLWNSLCF